MLKCILLLLSVYYYGIVAERLEELEKIVRPHGTSLILKKTSEYSLGQEEDLSGNEKEMLFITDEAETARRLLEQGKYVVILYHDRNRYQDFPESPYAIEDLLHLEYKPLKEIYQRFAGIPWEILQTDRLLLRESTLEDVDEFYRIYEDPSITRYMDNLFEDRDEEMEYMKAYADQVYGFYGYGLWTVILKETGKVMGRAGLSVREGYDVPELGFLIDAAYHGQGYGYEVCSGILKYAREELQFDRVQAVVDKRNIISRNLLEKLGFVYESDFVQSGNDCNLMIKIF